MERIGVKIYKASKSNLDNLKRSIANPVNFKNLNLFHNSEVIDEITRAMLSKKPIYCWAGLRRIEKGINIGDLILLVIESQKEAYLLNYAGHVHDIDQEISRNIGWSNNIWEHVVFMENSRKISLNDEQIKQIFQLTRARESSSRFANYIHDPVLYGTDANDLMKILGVA